VSVRSITYQIQLGPTEAEVSHNLITFDRMVKEFSDLCSRPRTHRVVTGTVRGGEDLEHAKRIVSSAKKHSLWGACMPVDVASDPSILKHAQSLIDDDFTFFNIIISKDRMLNIDAAKAASRFVVSVAKRSPIYNFRVGVSSFADNATPFFPFATVRENNSFTIGLELVNVLTEIVERNPRKSLDDLRSEMMIGLRREVERVESSAKALAKKYGLIYGGVDLSVAPYPYPLEDQSVSLLVEKIGNMGRSRGEPVFQFGLNGTYFINGFLTSVLKGVAKEVLSTGFNGVMYSLLEDTHLASQYDEGKFDINFLKHLATSCGVGIDMVPMECSNNAENDISSIIMDVYTASHLMNKPLGIRLLPIPGARVGDRTEFKHLFFTNTKIRDIGSGMTAQNLPGQSSSYCVR